jgi:DNA-binding NtrC family response regulator
MLTDLGSTNGTFVGDRRAVSVYLGAGDVVRVGHTAIAFESSDEEVVLDPAGPGDDLGVVGRSAPMQAFVAALRRFAPTDLSIVLEGETGAGKEVAARAIHRLGGRAAAPLVVVDCGALQANLVESELFGHERGAFTGAVDARVGAFESADGGTIFLDEVGEIPLSLQPKLLRVLEAREVKRLGANRVRPVDVRVVAATNRDLGAEVSAGRFREDLFFRLSEVRLRVPPLRERPEDVEPLARHFARAVDPEADLLPTAITELRARPWRGNVRELANVVRRAVVLAAGSAVAPEHLAAPALPDAASSPTIPVDVSRPVVAARDAVVDAFHRVYFDALLARYDGDMDAVAQHAGIHVQSVRRLLRGVRERE